MATSAAPAKTEAKPGVGAKSPVWRGLELFVTFVLQVCGGCGAVWGSTEWASVRAGPNNNNWRAISSLVGLVCFARWCLIQFQSDHRLDGSLASFLLQVLGAAGAIWGIAEILGLRVNYPEQCKGLQVYDGFGAPASLDAGVFEGPGDSWSPFFESCGNTYLHWRVVCSVVFLLFVARWNRIVPKGRVGVILDIHVATFVLDVVGGAGAIWGVSEVATLRLGWGDLYFGQPSFDFWRIACAPFFMICLFAWAADWRSREEAAAQQGRQEQAAGSPNAATGDVEASGATL